VRREEVEAALPRFTGEIQQIPPIYSAKKHQGERMYRLARRGEVVERQPVAVKILALDLLGFDSPFVHLKVTCSKGTYARSLCDDIGRTLGCGGHLHALCRTRAGRFSLEAATTLEGLDERVRTGRLGEVLIPIADALAHLPGVRVAPEAGPLIMHGNAVTAGMVAQFPPELASGSLVRILGFRKQLLSLAEAAVTSEEFGACEPTRIVLHPVRVFPSAA
jgi:tRNA pseudouridine55 synthase